MAEKNKTQKGFIQIPLLIAIIVSIFIVSIVTTGVVLYKQGKILSPAKEIKSEQSLKPLEEFITPKPSEPSDKEIQKRIDELEQKIKELEERQQAFPSEPQNKQQKNLGTITANELEKTLPYIGNLSCGEYREIHGSVSLWNLWGKKVLLTNAHLGVWSSESTWGCDAFFSKIGSYRITDKQILDLGFTDIVDFTFFEIKFLTPGLEHVSQPISSLDGLNLPFCPVKMPLGSSVAVIGFPVGAKSKISVPGQSFYRYVA